MKISSPQQSITNQESEQILREFIDDYLKQSNFSLEIFNTGPDLMFFFKGKFSAPVNLNCINYHSKFKTILASVSFGPNELPKSFKVMTYYKNYFLIFSLSVYYNQNLDKVQELFMVAHFIEDYEGARVYFNKIDYQLLTGGNLP